MKRTTPAIALLASAVVLAIAGCGSSTDNDSASTTNRQAAAGKLAYRAYGSRIDVQGGASSVEWPCKNVGALAADTQYVYFTNADGIGRTRWDGSGSANCNFSTQPATAITAAAGKVAELSGSRVDVVKGASDIAWPCKNIGSLAADSTGSGPANQSRAPSRKRARQPV